jgi:hypothetical protein
MAPRLKPLKDPKDIAAVPLTQPVLVEIAPTPTGTETDAPAVDAKAPLVEKPEPQDDGAAKLQKQLEDLKAADKLRQDEVARERKRADDALRQVHERDRQLADERVQREQAVTDNISSALSGAQAEQESAEAEYASAFQTQDPTAMAKAQGKIARAAAKVLNYEAASAELADRKKYADHQAQQRPQQQQQAPVDIVTAVNTNPGLLQTERDWLIKHQEVLVDPQRGKELEVAYIRATRKGHHRGTDAYFQFLDQELGYSDGKQAQAENQDQNGQQEEASIMSAPITREGVSLSSGQSQQSNRVVMTPEMREFAKSMGVTEEAYARQYLRLQADKKSNPDRYRA